VIFDDPDTARKHRLEIQLWLPLGRGHPSCRYPGVLWSSFLSRHCFGSCFFFFVVAITIAMCLRVSVQPNHAQALALLNAIFLTRKDCDPKGYWVTAIVKARKIMQWCGDGVLRCISSRAAPGRATCWRDRSTRAPLGVRCAVFCRGGLLAIRPFARHASVLSPEGGVRDFCGRTGHTGAKLLHNHVTLVCTLLARRCVVHISHRSMTVGVTRGVQGRGTTCLTTRIPSGGLCTNATLRG